MSTINKNGFSEACLCDENENENPLVDEIDARYNNLNERFVALKAEFKTLREQILSEKEQWMNELKETIQLERQLKETRLKHFDESEYKRKFELFKDFMFFSQSSRYLERFVTEHNYEQWLHDVENKCNMELEKIRHSMTKLTPLKKIVSTWILEDVGDGDYEKTEKTDNFSDNESIVLADPDFK